MVSRLLIEYDGREFTGWARQPGARTVQEELERALAVVLRRSEGVPLTVAGRTDAGVHALAQVASYVGVPAHASAVNSLLGKDVAVLACDAAAPGFDARRDASSRAYCYRILARPERSALWRGRALHWAGPLDVELLSACAQALIGTHDFTAFTPTDTYHVRFEREVYRAFWRQLRAQAAGGDGEGGELLEFWIEADTFMRRMNRVLVGTMLEVASGRRTLESFGALLEGRPRAGAGVTAPAHGLYLAGVGYGGVRVLDAAA